MLSEWVVCDSTLRHQQQLNRLLMTMSMIIFCTEKVMLALGM